MSEALADCKTMELLWALSKLLRRASSSIHQIGIQWNEQKTGKELFCAVKKIDWSQKHISWHIAYVLCVCLPSYINKQSPFYLSVLVLWLIFFFIVVSWRRSFYSDAGCSRFRIVALCAVQEKKSRRRRVWHVREFICSVNIRTVNMHCSTYKKSQHTHHCKSGIYCVCFFFVCSWFVMKCRTSSIVLCEECISYISYIGNHAACWLQTRLINRKNCQFFSPYEVILSHYYVCEAFGALDTKAKTDVHCSSHYWHLKWVSNTSSVGNKT